MDTTQIQFENCSGSGSESAESLDTLVDENISVFLFNAFMQTNVYIFLAFSFALLLINLDHSRIWTQENLNIEQELRSWESFGAICDHIFYQIHPELESGAHYMICAMAQLVFEDHIRIFFVNKLPLTQTQYRFLAYEASRMFYLPYTVLPALIGLTILTLLAFYSFNWFRQRPGRQMFNILNRNQFFKMYFTILEYFAGLVGFITALLGFKLLVSFIFILSFYTRPSN